MQTLNIGKVCQVRVRSRKTLVSSKDGEIILKSMSETKGDCLILSRSDFDLNRMCLLLSFLFRTSGKKGQLDEKDFHHCYGIFFPERAFWKLLDHSYVRSSFSTITIHIDNSLLKDALQFNILRTWMNIRAKSFIKSLVKSWNENRRSCLKKHQLPKNPSAHFEKHCTKIDQVWYTYFSLKRSF